MDGRGQVGAEGLKGVENRKGVVGTVPAGVGTGILSTKTGDPLRVG